ncbi:YjzD family protein [Vagococcus humatus]|uniref:DUF2929 domain-containing protein n=1 Tax=Vagococcus humatus TaxID=1889241 RepID=A0A429Z7M1_9ENTE|nr:YjzD family protein [Vagococcus humatus]RST89673.1 DUF2929 domain-containing protein [Vagococcus humatus]
MRATIVLIWSLILGQIISYLGAALNHGAYDFKQALMSSIVIAISVLIIGNLSQPSKKPAK